MFLPSITERDLSPVKYPSITPDSNRTSLTQKRSSQLHAFLSIESRSDRPHARCAGRRRSFRMATRRGTNRGFGVTGALRARVRGGDITMDAATVFENIQQTAAQFASQRRERQERRGLVAADFAQLREAGFLLTGVPVDQGGIWE